MPIPTSLEEIAQRQRALNDAMAEERRKDSYDGTTVHFVGIIELRRELVESANCVANDLIKYCRRLNTNANETQSAALGIAVHTLIDVAERNWNRTREICIEEIVNALAVTLGGVDPIRAVLDDIAKKMEDR